MKYYKNTNNETFVDPILANHTGLVEITEAEFLAIANPPKTAEQLQEEAIELSRQEAETYLASTDWYITRKLETGKAIPAEIIRQREQARLKV